MTTVKIAGREFKLAFTLASMMEMEKRIEGFSMGEIKEFIAKNDSMIKMLVILAETAAKLDGERLDVDEDWMALHIPPNMRKIIGIQIKIMNTISDGMEMEAEEDDEDEEVDAVLQRIQKKREATELHGDE